MFGKKSRKNKPMEAESQEKTEVNEKRQHETAFGNIWAALTGMNPAQLIPQVVSTVLNGGGTRKAWQWKYQGKEYIVMAWPKDQPIRACVIMAGPVDGKLKPATAIPLIEGLPNDLTIEAVHPHTEGCGADVAVTMLEGKNPMWFFDPFYGRDKDDLTPGVTHTFWLGAIALACRKALLDHITVASGQQFEAYVAEWLKQNPGKQSSDAPPLKLDISGKYFIMPGRAFDEYQIKAIVDKVEDWQLEKMPIKCLYLNFPFEDRVPMRLPLFVSQEVLKDYTPKEGDEIEAYIWMQGRIIDLEDAQQPEK